MYSVDDLILRIEAEIANMQSSYNVSIEDVSQLKDLVWSLRWAARKEAQNEVRELLAKL